MATNKQKALAKELVVNGSNTTMKEAMIKVGYSPNTAVAPTKVTESKGFNELLEKYLPDDKLLKVHEEALEAKKWNDFTGEREPDHTTRLKAVDLGYKLKGKIGGTQVNVLNQGDMSMGLLINEQKD
jgi:polynucleotide 5'-kinase involved in rRNA processing